MTMASSTLKDFIGNWQLFLLGLLLSVSPVLGQNTTGPSTTINTTTGAVTTTTTAPTTAAATTTPLGLTSNTTHAPNSTAVLTTAMPTVSSTTIASTGSTTQSPSVSTSTGAVSTTGMSSVSTSSVTSSSGMSSSMSTANVVNNTGGVTNGTTAWNNSMSMISCPSFMCNYSDCYSMYTSQNASKCPSGYNYCELIRGMGMHICYTVSCSASCSLSCVNASQSNCSVNCCNSTDCLNSTFASMMMTSTTVATTTTRTTTSTTSATTTTTTTAPTTQAGKKCHTGQCNGTECYKTFNTPQVCSSSQPHCQLKKETVGTNLQWTAGCTTNCSGQTPCKTSTAPPCHLECCNATLTSSCLWLNGTLNVPSFATRGPQLHSELLTSVLFVFAIGLML